MTEWKNLKAIERDLFHAQGHLSIDICRTVGSNDRPLVDEYNEETEEEFFKYCTGDGDFGVAPDLDLIKDMLNLVKASDIPDEEDDNSDLVISKLNPQVTEFIPKMLIPKKGVPKMRKSRNAAMASLLAAIGESKPDPIVIKSAESPGNSNLAASNVPIIRDGISKGINKKTDFNVKGKASVKSVDGNRVRMDQKLTKDFKFEHKSINDLLDQGLAILDSSGKVNTDLNVSKPISILEPKEDTFETNKVDYSNNKNNTASVSKVKEWLSTQHKDSIVIGPSNMFKRKKNSAKSESKSSMSSHISSKCDKSYKPSDLANEYYQKYVERSNLKVQAEQDIWTKAEQQMKEIDARMKLEAEQIASEKPSNSSSTSTSSKSPSTSLSATAQQGSENEDIFGMHAYKLPFHRHIWSDDCVVCELMEKHKHDVKSMKNRPELLEPPSFLTDEDEKTSQDLQ